MEGITIALISSIVPALLTGVGWLVVQMHKTRKRSDEVSERVRRGLLVLLRSSIVQQHQRTTDKGTITISDRQNFGDMMDLYKQMGGNGVVSHLDKDIRNIPVRPDRGE